MGISQLPGIEPATGAPATANVIAYTKSQVTVVGPQSLHAVDPTGVNANAFITVNTSNIGACTGAIFNATVISNGDRFRFEARHYGGAWQPTAAMAIASGYWDYEHRCYDAGGFYAYAVPSPGAADLRMVRVAGTAGANTCTAGVNATHSAFPSPPKYVGKRDITLMIRNLSVSSTVFALAPFDVHQENDDRTRTMITAVTTRAVRAGRRLWVQGYDVSYSPSGGTDRARVVLISRPNGVVQSAGGALSAGTDPSFDLLVNTAPGRAMSLPEPLEFQTALGVNQMNLGIAAWGTVGLGTLNATIFAFETM